MRLRGNKIMKVNIVKRNRFSFFYANISHEKYFVHYFISLFSNVLQYNSFKNICFYISVTYKININISKVHYIFKNECICAQHINNMKRFLQTSCKFIL